MNSIHRVRRSRLSKWERGKRRFVENAILGVGSVSEGKGGEFRPKTTYVIRLD